MIYITVNSCNKQPNMNITELLRFGKKPTLDRNITTVTTKCAMRPKNLDATRLPMNILQDLGGLEQSDYFIGKVTAC